MSAYRQESRQRWATTAAGWERHADAFRRDTMPVTAWMLDAAQPQPGDTVLDLAAGIGDTGLPRRRADRARPARSSPPTSCPRC